MRKLHHFLISPPSRFVRLLLEEKNIKYEAINQVIPDKRTTQLSKKEIKEIVDIPQLQDDKIYKNLIARGHRVICEYLEDAYPEVLLLGRNVQERVNTRSRLDWFDGCFYKEVTLKIIGEKVIQRIVVGEQPDNRILREGYQNLTKYFEEIGYWAEKHKYLNGDILSAVDFAAAAHISSLDYLGEIKWDRFPAVKDWYVRMKSRPGFETILKDRLPKIPPSSHYDDLDF